MRPPRRKLFCESRRAFSVVYERTREAKRRNTGSHASSLRLLVKSSTRQPASNFPLLALLSLVQLDRLAVLEGISWTGSLVRTLPPNERRSYRRRTGPSRRSPPPSRSPTAQDSLWDRKQRLTVTYTARRLLRVEHPHPAPSSRSPFLFNHLPLSIPSTPTERQNRSAY